MRPYLSTSLHLFASCTLAAQKLRPGWTTGAVLGSALTLTLASTACGPGADPGPGPGPASCPGTNPIDTNCDQVHDALGTAVMVDGVWAQIDFDNDGVGDGLAVDINGDGQADGAGYDQLDSDGIVDAVDRDGDGIIDYDLNGPINTGTGGAVNGSGGGPGTGGSMPGTGGQDGTGGSGPKPGNCLTETPNHSGGGTLMGSSDAVRYASYNTTRNGLNYRFIANGWGPGWESHSITYGGSKFSVNDFLGTRGSNYEPAGYPTVFCGDYSDSSSLSCGLPAAINSISELDTGLTWSHSGTGTDFNVAYDIWMANGGSFAGYLMVWYRDPPGNQPAGGLQANNIFVGSDDKRWDVWTGQVNGSPIVNYVRPNGEESYSLGFDAMNFVDHAKQNYNLPGDTIMSVAIGFEIWSGPVTNLVVEDFCVEVN